MPLVYHEPDYIIVEVTQRFFASKLALPIILSVDDYNYNINRVDITDKL